MASFTYLDEEKPSAGFTYLDDAPPKQKQNTGIVGDIGTALKRGVLQMPGMATGLADIAAAPVSIATGVNRPVSRAADWLGEQTGLQFGKWAEAAGAEYSPEMQQAQQNVEQAKGFFPTLGAVAQNPRVAAQVVAESLPSTIAGGLVARGAMGAVAGAEKLAALRTAAGSADAAVANAARRELLKSGAIAAGVGEGAVTAGQQMAQTGYDVDPALAAGAALGAGVGTGIIGGLSGRFAGSALGRKLGLSDIETSMAAGTFGENAGKAGAAGYARRIGAGAIQEGLVEEAPQSYQEQVWQNRAAGKPLTEGAAEAAALGAVAGGVMGAGFNIANGPLSKAVAAAPGAAVPPAVPVPDAGIQPQDTLNAERISPEQGAAQTPAGIASAAQFPQFTAPPQPVTGGAPLEQAPTAMPVPQATQNAPAAPGSPSPVSAADTPLPAKQAEAAGAPIQPPQGPLPSADQAEIAIPPAQGPEAAALPAAAKPAKGIAAAIQHPQQVTEGGAPLAQQPADVPLGRFGASPKTADIQTKKSEPTPAIPVAESIAPAPEAGDGKVATAQGGAASEIKSRIGIAGALVTPRRPTTGGAPLEQTPVAMPLGELGKLAAVTPSKTPPADPKSSELVGASVVFTSPSGRAKRGSVIRVTNGKAVVVSPVGQNYVDLADLTRSKAESTPLKGFPASDNSPGNVKSLDYARQELEQGSPHWYVANALADDVLGDNSKLTSAAFSYVRDADNKKLWKLIDSVARQLGEGSSNNGDVRRAAADFVARQTPSYAPQQPLSGAGEQQTAPPYKKATARSASHYRVRLKTPLGNFDVFVEKNKDSSIDDYKRDAKNAFAADSNMANLSGIAQISFDGNPEPVSDVSEMATVAKNAKWARIAKVEKAATQPQPKPRQQPQPAPIMRRDDLVGAIMRVTGGDGIASNMALTIAGDTAGRGLSKLRGLFTNRGTIDLGEVATRLREDEGFDVRDGEHLSELIRAASFGDTAVSMERAERDQDTAEEKRHRDYIRQNAKKLKIKSVAVKFSDLEKQVIAALTRRHERAIELLDERAKKRFDAALEESYALMSEDVVDAVLVDMNGRGLRPREFWNQATTTLRYMLEDAKAKQQQEALDAIEGAEPDWLKDDDGRGNQPVGGGEEANRVAEEAGGEAGQQEGNDQVRREVVDKFPLLAVPSYIERNRQRFDGRAWGFAETERRANEDPSNWNFEGFSVELTAHQLQNYKNAVTSINGALLAGSKGASPTALISSWSAYNILARGLSDWMANHPKEWADYKSRQSKVESLKIGDSVVVSYERQGTFDDGPDAFIRTIKKKNKVNWSLDKNGTSQLHPPASLLTIEDAMALSNKRERKPDEDARGEAGFDLAAQTPEEIAAAEAAAKASEAKAEKEKKAADDAQKKAELTAEVKKRSDAAAETFELGGNAMDNLTGQKDIFASPVEPKPSAKEAINDFGEKLEGARKDYAAQMKDAMSVDVAAEPLSKSWPEPDYQKLLDGGADPYMVAFVRSARDELPTKPQKSWKLAGWVKQAEMLRDMAQKLLSGNITVTRLKEILSEPRFGLVRESVGSRAELYELVGHKMSLKGVSFAQHFYSLYKGQENVRKWVVEQKAKATVFSNWPRELAVGDTKDEVLAAFKERIASLDLAAGAKRQPQFVIYRKRGESGAWVGKKIGREYIDLHKAADVAEARKYMAESLPALEAKLAKYKETPLERKADNQPRVGDDHRNGAPVTPEVFADTFGFRGVQFGNYVEQNRRQSDLNEAFDGLMDLAAVLGIPPRALSLNGQLGLAFGARGRGGKNAPAAHFETGRVVINLTKGGGPGSLAHEWWHSLDNYFAKQANKNSTEFVTAGARTDGVREAMRVAFNAVNMATSTKAYQARSAELDKRRSKPYWNTSEERSARAFEGYVIAKLFDQGAANDYLANVVDNEVWDITEDARAELFGEGKTPKTYPYPTVDEMPAVRAAFDEFFKTVETKESEDGNVALFSFAGQQSATADQFQLDRAKQLLADGANANAVRQQTGWFKNPSDGKWRYEIDDSGASLKAHGFGFGELLDALGKNLTLADVLDHPVLFAAYPSIAGSSVEAIDEKSQNNGELVTNKDGGFTIRVNAGLGEAKALSVMLHEIQHGIQNVEGFASGGNIDLMAGYDEPRIKAIENRISSLLGSGKQGKEIAPEINRLNARIAEIRKEDPYQAYRKLAGEVESRNVQQRQNFPADRRKYSDPLGTQDVAPEDVIVVFNGRDAKDAPAPANTTRASAMATVGASPADAAVFDMAAEGKSAKEILSFLSKASRRPFNRVLAAALSRIGVSSTVSIDQAAGWRNNRGRNGAKFAASYSPKTDTVALYTPREAERHVLHEFVHAASLKAIARGGPAARQMQSIFDYVQRTGTMSDQYGMGNFSRFPNETDAQFKKRMLDEFTAELFTNPQFQLRLKQLPAPSGSKLKSAWDWIVRVIANLLGLKTKAQETALDRALSVGAALLQENAALTAAQGGERFSQEQPFSGREVAATPLKPGTKTLMVDGVERPSLNSSGNPIHWSEEGVRNFWKWFKNSAVTDDHGRPLVLFHGTNADFSSIDAESSREDGLFFASPDKRVSVDFAMYRTTWGGANVMPAYVSAGKVLVVQGNGSPIRLVEDTAKIDGMKYGETVRGFASRNGYDAILFKDVRDGSGPDIPPVADVYAMFPSVQVKSATGNTGAFSEDPDIRFSAEQQSPFSIEDVENLRKVSEGDQVDGRYVRKHIPNTDSISASLDDYTTIGVREVPMSMFDETYINSINRKSADQRTIRLVDEIAESGEINPLIVAVDSKGAYIIEGGHRFDALILSNANSVPALVVVDESDPPPNADIRYSLAANWQQSPVAPGNLYQAAKKKAAGLLTPERLDKVIYETQDKFIDLRRIRDHIKEIGGTITDLNDAYLGEELYHKRLAYRTDQFLKEELQPFFADMKARGVEMPEFEKFLHARHAPEANAEMAKRNPNQKQIDAGRQKSAAAVRGLELNLQTAKARGLATVAIEKALADARAELVRWNGAQAFKGTEAERLSLSGMSNADASALMASLTPAQRADMDALAARVDAINEGTLQTLERYGLMDKASMNTWRNTYKHYVPLHRDEAHPDSVSHPIGQGFNVRGDASKRRTGSNQEVTNIFSHIAMQREAALTRGEKNRVMQKLYLMARQNPIADIWSVGKVPMIDTIDKATGFVRSVPDPQYKDKPNVITLRVAGKDVAIVMNEYNPQALRLAQSIKNLDVDDLHYLIPVVGKATRWFSSINTQYNPIFGLINFARDVQTAALNLSTTAIAGKQKEVFKDTMSILGDIIKNKGRMPTAGKWAPIYKEFNEVGGTTGYRDLFLTAEDRSKAVTDEIKALDRGKVSQAAHAVAGWLSDYNEAMENATRLAAYKAAIDNGMSKERAASLAKNLTVNFNRKGRQTRELGALYAFFNAAVQGTARMAQTLSGPAGKKIMLGGVLAGAASAMAGIAAMGGGDGEDDEWSKIPEFVKERSLIIPSPFSKEGYFTIPMPLGFHFLPNIGRLMVEMAVYKDKTLGKQMASLFTVLADAFNPLGGSAPPMQIIAPTVMDPFIALAQNKDWTGKPIYVENFNSLNPQPGAARAKDSATPIAKGMADIINSVTGGTKYVPGAWSPTPDQIDYVIGQLTGGVGRELGKLSSTIAAPFSGDELPAHKIPLLGRLYGSTAGATGQAGKFYENIKRANEVENELKGRRKDGIGVDDYLRENPKAVELAARGNAAERQIRALRQMRSRIVEAGGTDAASKARQINERMATVMRGFNMQVERMQ